VKRLITILLCAGIAAVAAVAVRAEEKAPLKTAGPGSEPATAVDSVGMLERAVAKDSTRVDDLARLGVLYLDQDQVDKAITVLGKAHALKPLDHKITVNLGVALDANNRPVQAQKYYKEVLAVFPDDSVASCRLASSLYSQSKYDDAVKLLDQIIHRTPRAHCAYFTMGVAFADAGIYKDAIRMWRKVVDLAPGSAEAVSAKESIDVLQKFVGQ
jgi:tetratricopeptide (TPR) repeat protein